MDRRPFARQLPAVALAVAIAGCAGSAVTTPSPIVPTAAGSTATATAAGPVAFADWTARQGFGGSSGLNNIRKVTGWLAEHRYVATAYDLDSDGGEVVALIAWLDVHPPTACWADFHATVRASLQRMADLYSQARAERTGGGAVEVGTADALRAEALTAYAIAAPASCP